MPYILISASGGWESLPPSDFHLRLLTSDFRILTSDFLPSEIQPHADHRPPGIDEHGRLAEVRAEQVVRGELFLRGVVERIEHVEDQVDAPQVAEGDRSEERRVGKEWRCRGAPVH